MDFLAILVPKLRPKTHINY